MRKNCWRKRKKSWHDPLAAVALVAVVLVSGSCSADEMAADRSPAEGDVEITNFVGSWVQLEFEGTVVHIDPRSGGDESAAKPADLILITDTPGDHLNPELIDQLRKPGAPVVLPSHPEDARDEASRERLMRVPDGIVMENGDRMTLAGVPVEAVAMYDLIPGDPWHAKGEGNGYIVTLGGKRFYAAGVTECVPEIQALEDIDVAFFPMNLPHHRMMPAIAAACVRVFRPKVVYPYHYREIPIDEFVDILRDDPIEVRLHEWYPWVGL